MFHIPTLAFIFPLLKQKRQYDLHGEEGSVAELGSVNVEDLGTVGRLFGALVSKAGIPVPTEITQKVLTAAQHIGNGLTEVPGFTIPPVENLIYGQVGQFSSRNSY